MTPVEIKIELLKAGITQTAIANDCGVSRQAVHQVVNGRSSSYRVRCLVASSIGKPVESVWPVSRGNGSAGQSACA